MANQNPSNLPTKHNCLIDSRNYPLNQVSVRALGRLLLSRSTVQHNVMDGHLFAKTPHAQGHDCTADEQYKKTSLGYRDQADEREKGSEQNY